LFVSALIAAGLFAALEDDSVDPRAAAVVERTHTTNATYSVYLWTTINLPGRAPIGEWAAEFHQGTLHRVETPRDRIVADCAAMTGAHLQVSTGAIDRGGEYARTACGIDQGEILHSRWVGRLQTDFGAADAILLSRSDGDRTYAVTDNGALIAETISDEAGELRLINHAVALLPSLPSTDIFSEDSLRNSVVADKYRLEPALKLPPDD
jgi:hypothetical protein